ncbi:hypothetical protein GJ496_003562 [Pomphorhynchus laevis]|nr:hypothetical protein GJ496_003562 [Pomphorhynchus laevis]
MCIIMSNNGSNKPNIQNHLTYEDILASRSRLGDCGESPPPTKRSKVDMPVLSATQLADKLQQDSQISTKSVSNLQRQILQLIGQHLSDLGLSKSVEALIKETNITFETPEANVLRTHIINGQWQDAVESLSELRTFLLNPESADDDMKMMIWFIMEEEVKELARHGNLEDAIARLRKLRSNEISGMHDKIRELVWDVVSNPDLSVEKIKDSSSEGRQNLLLTLHKYFPADVMLPPCRLHTLIGQALSYQNRNCIFHMKDWKLLPSIEDLKSGKIDCDSLLADHNCDRTTFPTLISQRIDSHKDEVWFCIFSHSGTMLCSASKDGQVITWNVIEDTHKLEMFNRYSSNGVGIASVSWSPDDSMILCTGAETCREAFVWKVNNGELVTKFAKANDDRMTTGGWYKDSKRFVVGGITGKFFCHNIDTDHTEEWEGVRVQCLHVLSNDTVLVADNLKRIREFRFDTMKSSEVLTEENGIITFVVNRLEDSLLINVMGQGIHLWDLQSRNLIGRYRGVIHGSFINHSSFGGDCCQFFANGSEHGTLSIWRRSSDDPICVLRGHSSTVNCVAWNPALPTMIVSAGDDTSLVCWAPEIHALNPQPEIKEENDIFRAAQLMPDGRPL